jgi:Na+/H+ antiporter NhaD/arsenite permease-like protein
MIEAAAGAVFAATFLALALGRIGRIPLARGASALIGGLLTALLLRLSWRVIDFDVIALLAGLMVLAGLAQEAGLFAGLRRRLLRLPPAAALWVAAVVVALASAVLLNDAAVVVLVPFLIPVIRNLGLPAAPSVALLAVAANIGSLLTPFGNPQNAVLARAAGLGVGDFLAVQGPLALAGIGMLGVAAACLGRNAVPPGAPEVPHAQPQARAWLAACVAAFLVLAALTPVLPITLGAAAVLAAAAAYAGLRVRLGRGADHAAWRGLDWNVIALFVGLYYLTGGLAAWFPSAWVPTDRLADPWTAAAATTLLSNVVGNVPAILALLRLDPAWTVAHAPFLVATSTLGGALLLTGSAASLLAADQARKAGVHLGFLPFLRLAVPVVFPLLVLAAWATW